MPYDFKVGQEYNRREDIHALFGGQQQGGISTPADFPVIFIFTGEAGTEYGYTDGLLDDGTFLYTGEGQIGDMQFIRGNLAVRDHRANNKDLLMFKNLGHGKPYRFLGAFEVDSWTFRRGPDKNNVDRQTIQFRLVPKIPTTTNKLLSSQAFDAAFTSYQELVLQKSGAPFSSFGEGLIGDWENYKSDLRRHALDILSISSWSKTKIGSGEFTRRMIAAIEIDLGPGSLLNNLVYWQGQKGPNSREHSGLINALLDPTKTHTSDSLLFSLFASDEPDQVAFDGLIEIVGAKYATLAYIFFLRNDVRYAPIQTSTMDTAFEQLGIDLKTSQKASWQNYSDYNRALIEIRNALKSTPGLANTSLIDAHTFCWTLVKLPHSPDADPIDINPVEVSIRMMASSVHKTVRRADGRVEVKRLKNKDLHMTPAELETLLLNLLTERNGSCALTGLPFHFPTTAGSNPNFYPSLDRIDSGGHYEEGNLQIVCRFANFWKSSSDDNEFRDLLNLIRSPPTH